MRLDMTAKEFIQEFNNQKPLNIHIERGDGVYILKRDVENLMEEYLQHKLKEVKSEQLVCCVCGEEPNPDFHEEGDTICVDCFNDMTAN